MIASTSGRRLAVALAVALSACALALPDDALAQAPPFQVNPTITTNTQTTSAITGSVVTPLQSVSGDSSGLAQATGVASGPQAPPLSPPSPAGALPSGSGSLSLGDWLLSPTLGIYTLYDHNIYSSPTTPISGPAVNVLPSILAEYTTGIFTTRLYASMGSTTYPTLSPSNDTFRWQTGFTQSYAPLRDLTFTVQGNFAHSTLANPITSTLPTPINSPGTPPPPGAGGVVAPLQSVVSPNDTSTLTASVNKEFNRAYMNLGSTISQTQFEGSGSSSSGQSFTNFEQESFYGNGGFWLTPLLYTYGSGIKAFSLPSVGPDSSSYRVVGGLGTAPISLFNVSAYFGWQGTDVVNNGTAGGDVYGGILSYFPTAVWNMERGGQSSDEHLESDGGTCERRRYWWPALCRRWHFCH